MFRIAAAIACMVLCFKIARMPTTPSPVWNIIASGWIFFAIAQSMSLFYNGDIAAFAANFSPVLVVTNHICFTIFMITCLWGKVAIYMKLKAKIAAEIHNFNQTQK